MQVFQVEPNRASRCRRGLRYACQMTPLSPRFSLWALVALMAGPSFAAERSPDGRQVRIVVSDHGEGVRPDEQRRIFEPFYRGREVAGSTVRGTGLGLSLARRIVEAHGGGISVRSVRGHGSAFTLQLPAEEAPQAVRTTEAAGG